MASEYLQELQQRLKEFAQVRDWEQFHAPKNLVMALSVEVAELVEHFQWCSESNSEAAKLKDKTRDEVAFEMADIFIYLMRLAERLDVDIDDFVNRKIDINNKKYPAEKVRGSSKKYTEYESN